MSEDTGRFLLLQNKYYKLLSWAESLNNLFTVMGGKLKCSAQGWTLAPFVCNGTKEKIPSEIKPPLGKYLIFER